MNLMTLAGPTANSEIEMSPHNRYPVNPGSMSQVPPCALNQPQVHQIPGNPPVLEPAISMQPAQRSLKEGKVFGVSEFHTACTGHMAGVRGGKKFGNTETPNLASGAGADTALPNSAPLKSSALQHHRACVWDLVLSILGILGKRKATKKQ